MEAGLVTVMTKSSSWLSWQNGSYDCHDKMVIMIVITKWFSWLSLQNGPDDSHDKKEKASKLHTQQVPPEDLFPCIAYFHLLLLPFLFFGLCLLLLLVSLNIDPVLFVLGLHMKYTVEVVPLRTYIVWFVIMW